MAARHFLSIRTIRRRNFLSRRVIWHPLSESRDGVVRLKDCVRVLDGFGSSLEVILPKLRNGYVVPDSEVARSLALENPEAFFLAPNGECFHNVTVTGGKPSVEGPLVLKRELRSAQQALAGAEETLATTDMHTAQLAHAVAELAGRIEIKSAERRQAEQESANTGAALRQLEGEVSRLERRLSEWTLQAERNRAGTRGEDRVGGGATRGSGAPRPGTDWHSSNS